MSINSDKRQRIMSAAPLPEQLEAMQDQIDHLVEVVKLLGPAHAIDAPKYVAIATRIKNAKAQNK